MGLWRLVAPLVGCMETGGSPRGMYGDWWLPWWDVWRLVAPLVGCMETGLHLNIHKVLCY